MPAAPRSSRCSTSRRRRRRAAWRRARSPLFGDEAAATRPRRRWRRSRRAAKVIEASRPVDERDWVRLTQAQFGPVEIEPGFWIVPDLARGAGQARAA